MAVTIDSVSELSSRTRLPLGFGEGEIPLLFKPKTEDTTQLRVFVVGEVGAEFAELASYSVKGGRD